MTLPRRRLLRTLGAGGVALTAGCAGRAFDDGGWPQSLDGRVVTPMAGDAERLYVGTTTGHLYAVRRDGSVAWRGRRTRAATTTAPVLDASRERVYLGYADGGVRAFDAGNGEHRWTAHAADRVLAAPVVGATSVFTFEGRSVVARDPRTGAARWRVRVDEQVVAAGSTETGDGEGGTGESLVFTADWDGVVHAIDAGDEEERWANRVEHHTRAPLVSSPGTAFVAGAGATLHALDARTGGERWERRPGPAGTSPAAVADGTVVAATTDGSVAAYGAADGTRRWSFDADAALTGRPVAADGSLFLSALDGSVHVVDRTSGRRQTEVDVGGVLRSAPVVDADALYAVTRDGTLVRRPRPTDP